VSAAEDLDVYVGIRLPNGSADAEVLSNERLLPAASQGNSISANGSIAVIAIGRLSERYFVDPPG